MASTSPKKNQSITKAFITKVDAENGTNKFVKGVVAAADELEEPLPLPEQATMRLGIIKINLHYLLLYISNRHYQYKICYGQIFKRKIEFFDSLRHGNNCIFIGLRAFDTKPAQ